MRRASLRELHLNTSSLVADVARGEIVVIEKHGVPVAELRPLTLAPSGKPLPKRERVLAKFPKVTADSGRFLEEDRS
jgi:antitoxin (DNA-binding transcriptional repressor) of toxin-antitoxin stability system